MVLYAFDGYARTTPLLDPGNPNQWESALRGAQHARALADGGVDGHRGDEVAYQSLPGETLASIARKYDQDLGALIRNNAHVSSTGKIDPDSVVFIVRPDAQTIQAHQAVDTDRYLNHAFADRTESMSDLSFAKLQNEQLWTRIELGIAAELRTAGLNQKDPVAATQALLTDIRERSPDARYQQTVTSAYNLVREEWKHIPPVPGSGTPTGADPAAYQYAPDYDATKQPDLALRAELTARLLGGPANGTFHMEPEQMQAVTTDKLALQLAGTNPLEQSVYANLYGGHDPLTNQDLKPLWERMGISREDLRKTLVEQPWKVASFHLGRDFAAADYQKLQQIDGPLGHLMNMGVDPRTALTLQATWSANFYGGHDPATQAQLKPIWQQWGMQSPEQLQQLFENDPAAAIALAELVGGQNPATGSSTAPPWQGSSPEQHGAANLQLAQNVLGVELLSLPQKLAPAGMWQPYVLGLTAPSVNDQIRYQNPLGLAQSPHIRNGAEIKVLGQTGIITTTMDALGGMGLFGLFAGGRPGGVGNSGGAAPLDQAATNPLPGSTLSPGPKYQVHGFFQVFPGGEQESVWLLKAQRIPKFNEQQLSAQRAEYEQASRRYHETHPDAAGRSLTAAQISERVAQDVRNEMARHTQSRFVKSLGSYTDAGGSVLLFFGTANESDGSRARRPMMVGVDWALAPDGSLDRLGGIVGGPFLGARAPGSTPYWHGAGLQFQMGRDSNGNWVPTAVPTPTLEWGTQRYQVYPLVYLDPDTHLPNGFNIWGGTGYRLAQVGFQSDGDNPQMEVNLTADPAANNGMGPHVAYSDPRSQSFSLGYMGGKGGKALGFGVDVSTQSSTKVFVPLDARGLDPAKQSALDLYGQLTGVNPPDWSDIPVGTGVSTTEMNKDTARVMAFVKLFTFSGSYGDALMSNTQVHRTGNQSWTVGRYEENQNEYSATAGVVGVGVGGKWWNARFHGEAFELTASGAQVDPVTKAAVDRYLAEGLFPAALELEGRFAGAQADTYKQLRDEFIAAKANAETKAEAARTASTQYSPSGTSEQDQARNEAQIAAGRYWTAFERLNDFCRTTFKPGDVIMPGLKLTQTAVRKTDGVSGSFLFSEFYRREATTGEIKWENNTVSTYELSRDWWFAPEVRQEYAGKTGQGPDGFTLSTQSEVKAHPPAVTDKPVGLPYDVIKDIPTNAYPVMLAAAGKDKDVKVAGKLTLNLSAQQILDIGTDLNSGPEGDKLWQSFAVRTSAAFAEPNDTRSNLYARAPEYIDNAPLGLNREGMVLHFLKEEANRRAGQYGVQVTSGLIDKFSRTHSPEAFRNLSEGERKLFTDLVLLTASGDHSPYETLAPLAVTQTDAADSPALLGEDGRSAMFENVVKHFEHLRFYPGNIDLKETWIDPARVHAHEDPNARIYMEPTTELLRFVRDAPVGDLIRGAILSQAAFETSLPEEITELQGKSLQELEEWLPLSYTTSSVPYYGEPAEINAEPSVIISYNSRTAAILIAIAMKEGSDAAWEMIGKYKIPPDQLFKSISTDDDEQVIRQALIDVLMPNAPVEQQSLLAMEQQNVDRWLG